MKPKALTLITAFDERSQVLGCKLQFGAKA